MRWIALSLLVINLLYLGWELGRDTRALVAEPPMDVRAEVMRLEKIDQTTDTPALKLRYGWQLPEQPLAPNP